MKKTLTTFMTTLVLATVSTATVNSKKCVKCHGPDWKKSAMGASKIVANMTHTEIADALKGYKNTIGYGHSNFKAVMKDPVLKYSDEELENFAQTIGK